MKYTFLIYFVLLGVLCNAQEANTITIDGQDFPIEVGKPFTYITESGESVVFEVNGSDFSSPPTSTQPPVTPSKNQFENKGSNTTYEDDLIRFQYPDNFSIATTQPSQGLQQLTMVSGQGGGIILQEFSTMNPEGLDQFFLSQLVGESQASSSQKVNQTIDGKKVKGLRASDDDGNPVVIYTHGKQTQGIVIALIGNQEKQELSSYSK